MTDEKKPETPPAPPTEPGIAAFDHLIELKKEAHVFDVTNDEERELFLSLNKRPVRQKYKGRTFIVTDAGEAKIVGFPNRRRVDMV